jgi:hypothetical protein
MIVKKSIIISKIIASIQLVGGLFLLIGFEYAFIDEALDGIDNNNLDFVLFLILMLLGGGSFAISTLRFAAIKYLKMIEAGLSEDAALSIEKLAEGVGLYTQIKMTKEESLVRYIFLMFKYKYINGFIDSEHSRFVFHMEGFDRILSYEGFSKNGEKILTFQETAGDSEVLEAIGEETVITCKNCGGINTIRKGSINECEYCGSPISEED